MAQEKFLIPPNSVMACPLLKFNIFWLFLQLDSFVCNRILMFSVICIYYFTFKCFCIKTFVYFMPSYDHCCKFICRIHRYKVQNCHSDCFDCLCLYTHWITWLIIFTNSVTGDFSSPPCYLPLSYILCFILILFLIVNYIFNICSLFKKRSYFPLSRYMICSYILLCILFISTNTYNA